MCMISWVGISPAFLRNESLFQINGTGNRIFVNIYLISSIKVCSIESYGFECLISFRQENIASPGNQAPWILFRYYPSQRIILVDMVIIVLTFGCEYGIFFISEFCVVV